MYGYGAAPILTVPLDEALTLDSNATIAGGRTQVDTTALTGGGLQPTTGRGNVTGQSDASNLMAATMCYNAHLKRWGDAKIGTSLPISQIEAAMISEEKSAVKWAKRVRNQTANMELARSRGKSRKAEGYHSEVREAQAKLDTARIRAARLRVALQNCRISGRSSGAPLITNITHAPVGMPHVAPPVHTQVSTTPVTEVAAAQAAAQDVTVTEVVTPTGEVVTAAVNGNGEVVAVSSAAPTLMDGGVLSTKNIILGLVVLGVGYTILTRKR